MKDRTEKERSATSAESFTEQEIDGHQVEQGTSSSITSSTNNSQPEEIKSSDLRTSSSPKAPISTEKTPLQIDEKVPSSRSHTDDVHRRRGHDSSSTPNSASDHSSPFITKNNNSNDAIAVVDASDAGITNLKIEDEEYDINLLSIPTLQNMNNGAILTSSNATAYNPFPIYQGGGGGSISGNSNNDPSRKLLFDNECALNLMTSPNNDQEVPPPGPHQDFGTPNPIFPSSGLDEIHTFQPFSIQHHHPLDDSYSANLLGAAFIPSPSVGGLGDHNTVPTNMAPFYPFLVNMNDFRAQHTSNSTGTEVNADFVGSSLSASTYANHLPLPFANSLPSLNPKLEEKNNNEDEIKVKSQSEDGQRKRSQGKTLDNLTQLSATSHNRSKRARSRKISRNLPLRKRHSALQGSSSKKSDNVSTPTTATRRSNAAHRLVSRSTSAEKKKSKRSAGGRGDMKLPIRPASRNRSRRQSNMPFGRASSASANRGTLSSENDGTITRVIQHFTPKRHTIPILSMETSSLPNAVMFGCKCARSKCLKLYCDCFQAGQVCSDRCCCNSCLNTVEESGKKGRRTMAIQNILDRRPDAFDVRVKKSGEGCSCKKNRCLKKYCDCYNIGAKCDEDKCRCVDCENYPSDDDDCDEASISSSLDDNEQDVSDHDAYDSATSFQEDEDEKSEIFALPKAESAIDNKALAAV